MIEITPFALPEHFESDSKNLDQILKTLDENIQSSIQKQQLPELEIFLKNLVHLSSLNKSIADVIKSHTLYKSVQQIIKEFSLGSWANEIPIDTILDDCARITSNCSAETTQSRCPALVSFVRRQKNGNNSDQQIILHFCSFQGGHTAWRIWKGGFVLASLISQGKLATILDEKIGLESILESAKTVVELGSGTGLVGLAFAKHYPKCSLLLTDANDHIVSTLQCSIAHNKEAGFIINEVKACVLDWGSHYEKLSHILPAGFQKPKIILASEVIYDSECLNGLVHLLPNLLYQDALFICCCATLRPCVSQLVDKLAVYGIECVLELAEAESLLQEDLIDTSDWKENKVGENLGGNSSCTLFIFRVKKN